LTDCIARTLRGGVALSVRFGRKVQCLQYAGAVPLAFCQIDKLYKFYIFYKLIGLGGVLRARGRFRARPPPPLPLDNKPRLHAVRAYYMW